MEKIKKTDHQGGSEASSAADVRPKASSAQVKHRLDEPDRPDGPSEEPLLIHGLTVERYREIYNSVLTPSVLAKLSSPKNPDYICQVLELKHRLWTKLNRPRLVEKVGEDGRVEVTEVFDLTQDDS